METHGGDPELCALLDSALADFDHQGKKGKHDDDDLDAFMYEHDTSAQEHAASRFQELLNDGKESFEPANTFSNGNIMKVG
jgi:hypothetical protein